MKGFVKPFVIVLILFSAIVLAGCSKQADINLNNYVAFKYDGFDGNGTVEVSIDYNKLLEEHGDALGEKNSMVALRILRKIEVKADKTEGLSNGDTINISFGDINKEEILNESGMNLTYGESTGTVSGLEELQSIDLFKGLAIKAEGNDTLGNIYIDSYDSSIPFNDIEYSISKTSGLSNGEKVKITAKVSGSKSLDEYLAEKGYKAAAKEYDYNVSGLTALTEYDPFNGVTVRYYGINGSATADIEKDYMINDYVYTWDYSLDKDSELSNGDILTLSISLDNSSKDIDSLAASYGLKFTAKTKEIIVEGLSSPLTDISMIDEAEFEQLKANDIEKIEQYFAEGMANSVEPGSLKALDYLGSIITYQEKNSWYDEHVALFNIYRCDVKCSFDEPRWVYWFSLYDDVKSRDDGSYNFDEIEPFCPLNNLTVTDYGVSGFIFSNGNGQYYVGYETLEAMKGNHIGSANIVFDNIDYTEDETKSHSFIPVYVNLDIVDESGAELYGDIGYSDLGCVPVYEDGTYTVALDLAQYGSIHEDVPKSLDGLTSFTITLINQVNDNIGSLNIQKAELSDISIICDGAPINVNNANLQTGIAPEQVIIWLFDRETGLTGKKAAVTSKGFSVKDRIEVTFTISGLKDKSDEDDDASDVTDNDDVLDGLDNDENTENFLDSDNDGDVNDDESDGSVNDDGNNGNVDGDENDGVVDEIINDDEENTGENGGDAGNENLYSLILVKPSDDEVRMIKILYENSDYTLIEAKELIDFSYEEPTEIGIADQLDIVENIKAEFEKYGAVAEIYEMEENNT